MVSVAVKLPEPLRDIVSPLYRRIACSCAVIHLRRTADEELEEAQPIADAFLNGNPIVARGSAEELARVIKERDLESIPNVMAVIACLPPLAAQSRVRFGENCPASLSVPETMTLCGVSGAEMRSLMRSIMLVLHGAWAIWTECAAVFDAKVGV